MKSFIMMLTFFTRIPFPMSFEFEEKDFAKGLWWMPVIGVIIGIPLWAFNRYVSLTNPYLMSLLTILIYIAMTGGLHLDGLADYFDGIFSGRTKERILEIMKDVHVGTFGVVGLILYFIAIFVLMMDVEPLILLLMPIVGKTMGQLLCCIGKYPRKKGMGMPLIEYGKVWHGILVSCVLVTILFFIGVNYALAGLITIIFALLLTGRTTQLIGGVTGDVIGASIELSQVVWLLVFAVMGGL